MTRLIISMIDMDMIKVIIPMIDMNLIKPIINMINTDMFKQIIKTTESVGTLWAIEDIIFYDNNSCMGGKWFSENDQWNIDMH